MVDDGIVPRSVLASDAKRKRKRVDNRTRSAAGIDQLCTVFPQCRFPQFGQAFSQLLHLLAERWRMRQ